MNDLAPFTFPETGHEIRVVTIDDEPWWIASDICTALGYANPSQALATHLDPEDLVRATLPIQEGSRTVSRERPLVNESGLYSLILRSNIPQARAFKRWVTHEVLPAIRKTGRYEIVVDLNDPLAEIERQTQLTARAVEIARANQVRAEAAEQQVRELEPKAAAHDTYLAAQGTDRLVRQVAKLLGWTEKQLRIFLAEEKFIFHRQAPCGQSQWDLYADHSEHFHPVEKVVEHSWGHCSHYTLYVTAAGVDAIQRRIAKRQSEMRAAIASAPVA